MTEQIIQQKTNWTIPLAIIVAGGLIALSLFYTNNNKQVGAAPNAQQPAEQAADNTNLVNKVTDRDHYKGDPNASVTIVEYSDFECPFCKKFHVTMNNILKDTKDVKWVYRQFPLDSLHPKNGRKAAIASECVGKLGGNDAFWKFTDEYFRTTPANDRWNIDEELDRLVKFAGVDKGAFDACYTSGEFDKHVQDDVDNAIATGGRGTPWSVVITKSGKTLPLNGAQPEQAVRQLIDFARQN